MKLYFTRHGKTRWNEEKRFQGYQGDSPLLEESYLAIDQLGKHLKDIPFEAVYASPQKRAKDTAEGIINHLKHAPTIQFTDDLREIGLGSLEGVKISEARQLYDKELDYLRYQPDLYDPTAFNGESYQDVMKRSMDFIIEAVNKAEKGPLLFVSHGTTLTGCIQMLAGAALKDARKMGGLGNNTLSVLDTKGRQHPPFTLETWNDNSFLAVKQINSVDL